MVGKSVELIREVAVVGKALFGIADFENSASDRSERALDAGIVHPFADFMGQSRCILRENARSGDIGELRVGLRAGGAMVAADAASAFSQVEVVGHEDRQRVWS